MELYKFINETTVKKYRGGFVMIDGRIYVNPSENTIKRAGYKQLVGEECKYDITTEYPEITYTDGENEIIKNVTIKKIFS